MICPKCQNVMQTVDRRGVHIEQCQGCRGIFLDRGELEQISNAEQNFYGGAAAPMPYRDSPPPHGGYQQSHGGYQQQSHGSHYRDSPPPYGHQGSHGSHGSHRRRRGFMQELFD